MEIKIGKRISELRDSKGLSQREFAAILGVSNGAIGMWETDKRQPDLETIVKIASFFDISIDYLLGNESEHTAKSQSSNSSSVCDTAIGECVLKSGYSYEEVANKLGISENLFLSYVSNRKDIPYKELESLSNILDVSTDFLLGASTKSRHKDFDNILPFQYNYEISKKIRKLCDEKNIDINSSYLENLLCLSDKEIFYLIEYGFVPHVSTVIKLANELNVSSDYLLCIIDEQDEKYIGAFKQLTSDNKDIIVGEIKKLLKEQRYEDSVAAESKMKEAK